MYGNILKLKVFINAAIYKIPLESIIIRQKIMDILGLQQSHFVFFFMIFKASLLTHYYSSEIQAR